MTIQTREVVVIRGAESHQRAWCAVCQGERVFLSPEDAAGMAGVAVRAIYRCVEQNKVHYMESEHGNLLVCGESLPKAIRSLEGGMQK